MTAFAISDTARPASLDVEAICCDAPATLPAVCETFAIMPRIDSTIVWNAFATAPISSFEWDSTFTVRSPCAARSAAALTATSGLRMTRASSTASRLARTIATIAKIIPIIWARLWSDSARLTSAARRKSIRFPIFSCAASGIRTK